MPAPGPSGHPAECSTHPGTEAMYVTAHPLPADPLCPHCAAVEASRGALVLPLAARARH